MNGEGTMMEFYLLIGTRVKNCLDDFRRPDVVGFGFVVENDAVVHYITAQLL